MGLSNTLNILDHSARTSVLEAIHNLPWDKSPNWARIQEINDKLVPVKEDDTVLINKLTQLEDKLNETQLSHETRYS